MRALVLLCLLEAALAHHHHHERSAPSFSWSGLPEVESRVSTNTDNVCGIDSASCGCCVIQREIAQLETYINSTLNMLEEEYLQTNKSLTILQNSRTAFSLGLWNSDLQKCVGPNSYDSVIVYRKVFLNLGDDYDADTGVFTVSRSGLYMLAVTVASDAGAQGARLAICAELRVNDRAVSSSQDVNRNDQEDSSSVVLALALKAGDQVTVNLPRDCYVCDDGSHYNTFTGYLLYSSE